MPSKSLESKLNSLVLTLNLKSAQWDQLMTRKHPLVQPGQWIGHRLLQFKTSGANLLSLVFLFMHFLANIFRESHPEIHQYHH